MLPDEVALVPVLIETCPLLTPTDRPVFMTMEPLSPCVPELLVKRTTLPLVLKVEYPEPR